MILAALALSLAVEANAVSPGPPRILHFTRYASPNGEYVLEVDPSTRSGAGPGTYRLLRGEEEVWAKELPVTMWEAAVSDLGHVGGYAYSAGANTMRGDFHVLLLSPAGDVVHDEAVERGHGPGPDSTSPTGGHPVAHAELDRFVLRIWGREDHGGDRWAAYRLSTGEALPPLALPSIAGEEEATVAPTLHPLPGTDLLLVHWLHRVHRPDIDRKHWDRGAAFSLVDAGGTTVWHHTRPGDFNLPGSMNETRSFERLVKRHGLVHGRGAPGRFSLWFVKERQLVTFLARRDPGGEPGWQVEEVERAAYAPPLDGGWVEPTPLELVPLGSVELEPTVGEALEAGPAALDHHGRVLLQDRATRRVYVHDLEGELRFVCVPAPGDIRGEPSRHDPFSGNDGSIWSPVDRERRDYVRYDASGKRLYRKRFTSWHVRSAAERNHLWIGSGAGLQLTDPQGTVLARVERRGDKRWIRGVRHLTTSPTGAPVIVEGFPARGDPDRPSLVVFDTEGTPRHTYRLPFGNPNDIAVSERWIAIETQGNVIYLVRTADGVPFRCSPGIAREKGASWCLGLSPDGAELRVLEVGARRLHRFALPD